MWTKSAARGLTGGLALAVGVACGGGAADGPDSGPEPRSGDGTGAVSSLSGDDRPGGNQDMTIEAFLRGQVPGLQVARAPDGGVTVRIRGGGGQEPLVVIDGVPIEPRTLGRTLANLNPRDIEEVEVLRDVASTSLYGTRGAYGVLLITTTEN